MAKPKKGHAGPPDDINNFATNERLRKDFMKVVEATNAKDQTEHVDAIRQYIKQILPNTHDADMRVRLLKARQILQLYDDLVEFGLYINEKNNEKGKEVYEALYQATYEYVIAFITYPKELKEHEWYAKELKQVGDTGYQSMGRDSHALYYLSNILIGISIIGLIPLVVKGAVTGHGFFYETTRQTMLEKINKDVDKIEPGSSKKAHK